MVAKPRAPVRVLLVDDAKTLRFTLVRLLVEAGYVVDEAESLEAARQRLATGAGYQTVILDRYLPDGGGLELVPELRSRFPEARIVLLTGLPEDVVAPNVVDAVVAKTAPFETWEAELRVSAGRAKPERRSGRRRVVRR